MKIKIKKISATLLFAIIFFSNNIGAEDHLSDVSIHGFISQGYLKTDKNNYFAETEDGSFEFNEMGINFTTEPVDKLRIGVQFLATDLGIKGNDEILVDWAIADYRWQDWLGLRVGQNKGVVCFYNATRDLDMLRTNILLPQSVYSDLFRDTFSRAKGVEFYGRFLLGPAGIIAYETGFGLPYFSEDTGTAYAFTEAFKLLDLEVSSVEAEISPAIALTWYTPLEGFRMKSGWFGGKNLVISGSLNSPAAKLINLTKFEYRSDFEGYFVSMEYQDESFSIVGEFLTSEITGEWDLGEGFEDRAPVRYQGWYIAFNYDFSSFFKAGVCYSEFIPYTDNRDGEKVYSSSVYNDRLKLTDEKIAKNSYEAWLKTTTGSIRFDLNESWLLKFEVSYNDGFGAYTSAKNPDGLDRYWFLYSAKMTFTF